MVDVVIPSNYVFVAVFLTLVFLAAAAVFCSCFVAAVVFVVVVCDFGVIFVVVQRH